MEVDASLDNIQTKNDGASCSNQIPISMGFTSYGDKKQFERPINLNERFLSIVDHLDTKVEDLRKEAFVLQEKRDKLLISLDFIKNDEKLQGINEFEREDIFSYLNRVNERLSTVELHVKTIRDKSQEDALHQVNNLIDALIKINDPVVCRMRCQTYINACSAFDPPLIEDHEQYTSALSAGVDENFESALLGCTGDDQKIIKRRLYGLIKYLSKQIITE